MKRKCSLRNLMIIIFLLCAVICSVGIIRVSDFQNSGIPSMKKPAFEEGWSFDTGDRQGAVTDFPFIEKGEATKLTLEAQLPKLDGNEYLSFSNQYSSCQVFVDGEKIYDYGDQITAPYGRMLGNISCNIPLKSQYSGKAISICLKEQYDFAGFNIEEILLGTGSEIRFYYAKANAGVLACALLMCILSAAMFTLYYVQKKKKFQYDYHLFLQLGIFAFIGAVWILTDSLLPQFIFDNTLLITVISFWSFMAMPVPVINIIRNLCHYGQKVLNIAEKMILLNMIVQTLLYILNIADFPQMLPVTHGILLFTLVCTVYALARDSRSKEGRFTNDILFGVLVLILFGLLALANFYVSGTSNNNSLYYRWGIIIFVILLAMVNIKRMGVFLEEWEQNRVLSKLAFTDIMTKTRNRSAYERYADNKADVDAKKGNLSLILIDLNDLKKVNDTYGHNAGDQVLVKAARCVKEILGDLGEVYRIGGDEFVVIIEGKDVDGQAYREKLSEEIERRNQKAEHPFTLAFGFASAKEDDCENLKELQEKADLNMYMDKQNYKK